MNKSLVIFIPVLLLASAGTWWFANHAAETRITALQLAFSQSLAQTNTDWLTQMEVKDAEIRGLQKQINDIQRDRDASIESLKQQQTNMIDNLNASLRNELRSKDTEIAKMMTAWNVQGQRQSRFDTLQASAVNLFTNLSAVLAREAASGQPLGGLLGAYQSFTNAFSAMDSSQPAFEVTINRAPLSDNAVVIVPTSREFSIEVKNLGDGVAEQIGIDFTAPVNATNILSFGWVGRPPQAAAGDPNTPSSAVQPHWQTTSTYSVPGGGHFTAPSLFVLTNFPALAFPATITVSYGKAKPQTFNITATVQ